jgi:hypothetical protein
VIASLPAALGRALLAGRVAMATHIPLDGLAGVGAPDLVKTSLAEAPPEARRAIPDPEAFASGLQDVMAPLSSLSMWLELEGSTPVAHVALAVFGDDRSPDGKAARDAIEQVAEGKDASIVYASLATDHGATARGPAYKARAGEPDDASMTAAAIAGIGAAIAIPAFVKYMDQAEAAGSP